MDNNAPQPPTNYHRKTPNVGSWVATAVRLLWAFLMIVVVLLIVRFILSLIGANPDNDFATLIYNITYIFVAPFQGLLQVSQTQIGVIRIEYETLVAIVVYLLFGAGVTALINTFRR